MMKSCPSTGLLLLLLLLLLNARSSSTALTTSEEDSSSLLGEKVDAIKRLLSKTKHSAADDDDDDDDAVLLLDDLKLLLSDHNISKDVWEDLTNFVAENTNEDEEEICPASPFVDPRQYADRHIHGMMSTAYDPDCMEREFDASSDDYDPEEVVRVFSKCHLLVIRNAFPQDFIAAYKKKFFNYLGGLHLNKISREGKSTHGEGGFLLMRGSHRWEVLMPQTMAEKQLYNNKIIQQFLVDQRVLGPSYTMLEMGAVLSDSGATAGDWHFDDDYLFGDTDSFATTGVAGHDLPPFCINMMVAVTNVTYEQGPTEFCLGTSHLKGLDHDPPVVDESLVGRRTPYSRMRQHRLQDGCPPKHWRAPLLRTGDIVLFDYQIDHRGGQNSSPNLRPMIFVTYARAWYRDSNFDTNHFDEEDGAPQTDPLIATARFAIPEKLEDCADEPECINVESIRDFAQDSTEGNRYGDNSNYEDDMGDQHVRIGNKDVAEGSVYADEEFLFDAKPGTTKSVTLPVGAKITLENKGQQLYEWTVIPQQNLIMIHKGLLANR